MCTNPYSLVFTPKNRTNMIVQIQIPDSVYTQLLQGNNRLRGSIALISPSEGNFNAHRKTKYTPCSQYMKLPHGRISISEKSVRMSLSISRKERIDPAQVILGESIDASSFIEILTDDNLIYSKA